MSIKPIDRRIGERANEVIAQGYLTNSKNPATDLRGVFPTHFSYGRGCTMVDTNGEKWIDWVCALGANHFGYGNQKIDEAVFIKGSFQGQCLTGSLEQEVITAEKIRDAFPFAHKVKFVNDGTEACLGAIRAARAYHQGKSPIDRKMVLSEGYHGWSDEFIGLHDNCVGTPFPLFMDKFNLDDAYKAKELKNYRYEADKIAAVILEPVILDDSRDRIEKLKWLQTYCTEHDIVLIFDEVVTGLRYDSMSVAKCFGLSPDLVCFGKAFGNGHKTGFFTGRADIMDSNYFVSGTYFSHYHSLKAIEVTLDLAQNDPQYNSKNLNTHAKNLIERLNEVCNPIITFKGWGCRFQMDGDWEMMAIFRQELAKARHITKTTWFVNYELKKHFNELIDTAKYVMGKIKSGNCSLECPLPIKPIAQVVREGKN
jgi:glutamate-1-semialdehyde 2,1-aminomutase